MGASRIIPALRRIGLAGLVALATVMVGAVVLVMLAEDRALDPDEVFPEPVVLDPAKRPEFDFPESVRTYDLSLNRFLDRFARVCTQGKYADFRLMLSSRAGDPIVARRFESMFHALKQVRILAIEELPLSLGLEEQVYIMLVEYDLEDYAANQGRQSEQRRLAITKEGGGWRIGPIPHEALAKLQARRRAASRPAPTPDDESLSPGQAVSAPALPAAAANQPAKLDP